MTDILILAVVAVILLAAVRYIVKAKRNGAKCIGCPSGNRCSGNCCSCHAEATD